MAKVLLIALCMPTLYMKKTYLGCFSAPMLDQYKRDFSITAEAIENTARSTPRTKKDKETTENTEHAEIQIDFFRDFRAFRSCQELIVVERLSGSVFQLFAVSNRGIHLLPRHAVEPKVTPAALTVYPVGAEPMTMRIDSV